METLTITTLIKQLEAIREVHGDLQVTSNDECGSQQVLQDVDLYAYKDSTRDNQMILHIDG
jgi:hypothetical protein